eukprot:EG_transcript_5643
MEGLADPPPDDEDDAEGDEAEAADVDPIDTFPSPLRGPAAWRQCGLPAPCLDPLAQATWLYPTDPPERPYQRTICETALYHNTLVCLPTGLGKTFIAAVVMLNFWRWFPAGKVVFMAPTRPLVAQQIHACQAVVGLPPGDLAEITGKMLPAQRTREWVRARVFFATPHVVLRDMVAMRCPVPQVVCIVIDEAHRAVGQYPYCGVVQLLQQAAPQFRVLALTATPGTSLPAVQAVVANLCIARLEVRAEDDPELAPYTHSKLVEGVVVPANDALQHLRHLYDRLLQPPLGRLRRAGAAWQKSGDELSRGQLMRQLTAHRAQAARVPAVERDFMLLVHLQRGWAALTQHGFSAFLAFLDGQHPPGVPEEHRAALQEMKRITEGYVRSGVGHPKLHAAAQLVGQHFAAAGPATRVLVFAQYRTTVADLVDCLAAHRPAVQPMAFVGQADGLNQKEQREVVAQFRAGGFNTLVATCVGEEGLDIGEVDLIVCYDVSAPTSMVQRMGRTGRRRPGCCKVLLNEGASAKLWQQRQNTNLLRDLQKALSGPRATLQLFGSNPRMLPRDVFPSIQRVALRPVGNVAPEQLPKTADLPRDKPQAPPPNFNALAAFVGRLAACEEWRRMQAEPQPTRLVPHSAATLGLCRALQRRWHTPTRR